MSASGKIASAPASTQTTARGLKGCGFVVLRKSGSGVVSGRCQTCPFPERSCVEHLPEPGPPIDGCGRVCHCNPVLCAGDYSPGIRPRVTWQIIRLVSDGGWRLPPGLELDARHSPCPGQRRCVATMAVPWTRCGRFAPAGRCPEGLSERAGRGECPGHCGALGVSGVLARILSDQPQLLPTDGHQLRHLVLHRSATRLGARRRRG